MTIENFGGSVRPTRGSEAGVVEFETISWMPLAHSQGQAVVLWRPCPPQSTKEPASTVGSQ